MNLLVIDVGSQSVRASIIDDHGQSLAKSQRLYRAYDEPEEGIVEQDAHYLWAELVLCCQHLQSQPNYADVDALTLCCQSGSVVAMDAKGQAQGPLIHWLDQRSHQQKAPLGWWWPILAISGQLKTVRYLESQVEARCLQQQHGSRWSATRYFGLLSAFLHYHLCGNFVDAAAAQVGYLPFDFRRQQWASSWDWKWRVTGVQRQQLPQLFAPGQCMGQLTAEASALLGLKPALKVIAAASDKACEVMGCGATTVDQPVLSLGTTASCHFVTSIHKGTHRFIPPFSAAMPGFYNAQYMIYRGFYSISWFVRQFAQPENQQAQEQQVAVETLLEPLLVTTQPGCEGLMFLPHLAAGLKDPEPGARAMWFGIQGHHQRAHFYRALIEGLAYELRRLFERGVKRHRAHPTLIRVAGGGSQSDGVLQVLANVLNIPIQRVQSAEASSIGAALTAFVGLGYFASFDEAVGAMVRPGPIFRPEPQAVAVYRQYYAVYLRLYPQIRSLNRQLKSIAIGL